MGQCETKHKEKYPELILLGYNSSEFYRKHADDARNFHDYSCLALIVIFNILGVLIAQRAFPDAFRPTGWPIVAYGLGAVIAAGFVMPSTWWPHRFEGNKQA